MNKMLKNTKALKNEHFYLTNAFFCDIITEREIKRFAQKIKICTMHQTDISPDGEDTHALRLTSKLVDLRAGYAKWIRRTKFAEPHLLGSP